MRPSPFRSCLRVISAAATAKLAPDTVPLLEKKLPALSVFQIS